MPDFIRMMTVLVYCGMVVIFMFTGVMIAEGLTPPPRVQAGLCYSLAFIAFERILTMAGVIK